MTKRLLVLLMGVLLIAALLAGCGGPASAPSTLREYLEANPDELAELEAEMAEEVEQMSAMFGVEMSIAIGPVGDHELAISYRFHDPELTADAEIREFLAAALGDSLDGDAAFYYEMAEAMREDISVDVLYLTIRYVDAGGAVLAERTFAGH